MLEVRARGVGGQGGIPVSNLKLDKVLYLFLVDFLRAYGSLDYENEDEFRQMLKEHLERNGLVIDDTLIDAIINSMPYRSWEH